MSKWHSLYNYLIYRVKSVNEHGVHSPFVFDLLNSTIYNKADFYPYQPLEKLRESLLDSGEELTVTDLGAGSQKGNKKQKTIREIARNAAKSKEYAQLLFRLVNHFQPAVSLELGTSLGISTAYMASASSKMRLITIEGSEEIAAIARQNFQKLELHNIELHVGNFDEVLPVLLKEITQLDLVFFDGNHRKEPTLRYFRQCLEKVSYNSVFIFDDIYWSEEMAMAWEEIKKHERVTVTLDLFQLGIVFFRKEQVKQHFRIRY